MSSGGPRGPHAVVLRGRHGDILRVVAVRISKAKAERWLKSKECASLDLPLQLSLSVEPVKKPDAIELDLLVRIDRMGNGCA